MKRQKLNSRRTAALLASTLVLSQAEPILALADVKVEAAAVSETLLPEVEGRTELPLLPITPRMTVPETGLDEG